MLKYHPFIRNQETGKNTERENEARVNNGRAFTLLRGTWNARALSALGSRDLVQPSAMDAKPGGA
jgi:hypothetical protein